MRARRRSASAFADARGRPFNLIKHVEQLRARDVAKRPMLNMRLLCALQELAAFEARSSFVLTHRAPAPARERAFDE